MGSVYRYTPYDGSPIFDQNDSTLDSHMIIIATAVEKINIILRSQRSP